MVKAVVCCGKFPSNIETVMHRCFIHTSKFPVSIENKQYVFMFLVFGAGDGGENPAFWYIPVRWRQYPSGRSWTARDHKDTHKLEWERECRSVQVQPSTHDHTEKSSTLLRHGGNTTRTRLRTETFNGAIVSGTWPDPDSFYTTKPLEVCQSHTRTHTNCDRQPWCYSGAILTFIHAALGINLTWTTSKTNRQISGDVISQLGRFSVERPVHTHSHTPWHFGYACIS